MQGHLGGYPPELVRRLEIGSGVSQRTLANWLEVQARLPGVSEERYRELKEAAYWLRNHTAEVTGNTVRWSGGNPWS